MNLQTLLQRVQDESVDTKVRLSILEELKQSDELEVFEILVHSCFSRNRQISRYCQSKIKQLPKNKLQSFFSQLFNGNFGTVGQKYFLLMDKLRSSDMMAYILRMIASGISGERQNQQIRWWLRQSGMISKYLQILLTFPPTVAKNAFILLSQIDDKMPTHLLDLTKSLSPKHCLGMLGLLGQLDWNDEVALLLIIRRFIEHPHPIVRARTAYLVSGNLRNIWFLRRTLDDPVPEVRLSTLKSIAKFSYKFSHKLPPKITDLLYATLGDPDVRVHAKAAQTLYTHKDIAGLRKLTSMLKSSDLDRVYGANLLGKLKEISVCDKLKALAETDPNQRVRLESLKAVKILDGQIDFLIQQFNQLEGFVTRLLFSENQTTDLLLSDSLQNLDPEALEGLIQSIGLSPDTAQQFINIANETGVQGVAIPVLLATVTDADGKVNDQKAADLDQLKRVVDKTVQQLQSDLPDVVSRTFDELRNLQRNTIKTMIIPALHRGNPKAIAVAAKILHDLEYNLGSNKLAEMITDSDPQMRMEAAEVLSTLADEFAIEHLKQLENDPNPEVQQLAQKGLIAVQSKLERTKVPKIRLHVTDFDTTQFPTVKLYVRVTDDHDQSLKDAEINDFVVLEGNDQPAKPMLRSYERQKSVVASMVMDYSASMTEEAIGDVEAGTKRFIDKLQPTDSAAILKFAEEIEVVEKLTQDKTSLADAIEGEYRLSTQGTALYDSIIQAVDQLDSAKESIKVVVVNTDGADTASDSQPSHATGHARENNTAVYTIGLGDEVDTDVLQQISHSTDGRYYAAANSGELQAIYEAIFNNIRFEYEISYESQLPKIDASNGTVEVYIEYGGHKVKAIIVLSLNT